MRVLIVKICRGVTFPLKIFTVKTLIKTIFLNSHKTFSSQPIDLDIAIYRYDFFGLGYFMKIKISKIHNCSRVGK